MKFVPTNLGRSFHRTALQFKKNSPGLMFGLGVAGAVTSTVLACRATLKLPDMLDEFKTDIEGVKSLSHHDQSKAYPVQEYKKDLAYAYGINTMRIVRLYAPAVIVGGSSIALLTGSHVALTRRNAALTAAYSAVQLSYDAYRERVRDEYGEEKELDLYHATRIEKMMVDDKVEEVRVADPTKWSPYARFFDEGSRNWVKHPELNLMFIRCQQNYANDLLQARGHVFLNEVYDMLGIDRSQAGQVVGWVIGDNGDNYIDFGLYQASSSRFVNGWERNVLLDFNVDGVIYNKI